ncbi:MAG TPA: PAS domain-containing protein [Candidatus Cloacimonadota bacterium]|nr:PAS domain-containing protein [Candidatus Cloacimonadota bacterium]HPS37954.1 PAS domain-containing protein [Candidatus Cloacimonadota bacterium]
MHEWIKDFAGAATVCDKNGTIIEMNEKACATFASYGGSDLIGKSLYDYHPEHCNVIIREMLQTGRTNAYTIEKQGKRKLIYQQPLFENGEVSGIVELSLELPDDMPHYVRS